MTPFLSGRIYHYLADDHARIDHAARGGESLPVASKLRLDHGALTALLVPTPTPAIIAVIRAILERHNPLEESPGGVYEQCEQLAGAQGDEILKRLKTAPAVKARRSRPT